MSVSKRVAGIVGGLVAVMGSVALANDRPGTRYEYAPVVDVEPIVRVIRVQRPREECWDETVYEEHPVNGYRGYQGYRAGGPAPFSGAAPTIAGGLIGGLIGRQFGGGKGRDGMTLVGTLVGAAIAGDRARQRQYYGAQSHGGATYERRPVTVERCRVDTETFEEERIEGYHVTYEYQGERYTMRMAEPPGEQIRLRVTASPVGRY